MKMPRKPEKPTLLKANVPTKLKNEYFVVGLTDMSDIDKGYELMPITTKNLEARQANSISLTDLLKLCEDKGFKPSGVTITAEGDDSGECILVSYTEMLSDEELKNLQDNYKENCAKIAELNTKASLQHVIDLHLYEIAIAEYQIWQATETLKRLKKKK